MLKPTIRYNKQMNGKYLLTISYRGKVFSTEIDKLPFTVLCPQKTENIYSKSMKGEDTVFEKISDKLFNLKLNNQQVEAICKLVRKGGGK